MDIKVNILDLLDAHWMLTQMIEDALLKAVAPNGTSTIMFDFVNDGQNMWAHYKFTNHDAPQVAALLSHTGTKWTAEEIN